MDQVAPTTLMAVTPVTASTFARLYLYVTEPDET